MRNGTRLGVLAVLAAVGGGAAVLAAADGRDPLPDRLSGLINDYTPGTVKNGPYEMRGEWSLDVHGKSGKASFSAVMNMETSDWGASKGIIDPDVPESRGAHTHHITMTNATVTRDPSVCPPLMPPTTGGFVVTGPAHVTGNGSPAPFESNGNPLSTLQLCFTGGSAVELSNFTLVFTGLATGHFGTQAIHGVVTCTWPSRTRSNGLCDDDKPGLHGDDGPHPNDHGGGHFH